MVKFYLLQVFQSLKLQKCKIVVSHQQLILHLTKEDGVIEWPFPMIRRSQMLNGWATPRHAGHQASHSGRQAGQAKLVNRRAGH